MPMFDDPKKELRRLQAELLAEEEPADDLDDIGELLEGYEEEGYEDCFEEDYEEEYGQFQRPSEYRNFANGYGQAMTEALMAEEADADRVLYRDDYRKAKRKRRKGVRGLIVLAILEMAAIVLLVGWWLMWRR